MLIRAGTSGFSYAAWRGTFYPPKLPATRMLGAYAGRLPTVEINATFYRMPRVEMLENWRAAVPPGFVFALKGSQRVTHMKRLDDVAEEVTRFYGAALTLKDALGPVLWQLPPWQRKDLGRLKEFLALLPKGARAVLEFRHVSWFGDDVLALLADAGVAMCIAESEERATPVVATTRFGYLRLRRPDYDAEKLADWLGQVRAFAWDEAYVFFKHEDEGRGPAYALQFGALAGGTDALGLEGRPA
jgi:uncharacterized protein YecE (DUF72 family)